MKKMTFLSLIFCLFSTAISAAIPPGQWQCLAYDSAEKSYEGLGLNMRKAMQAATMHCKRDSQRQKSCKTAQSYCEQGPLSLVEDRCLVTDDYGHSWNTTGEDACKTAMELCNKFQYLNNIASLCSIKH